MRPGAARRAELRPMPFAPTTMPLAKAEIAPHRDLEADLEVTDPVLRAG